MKQRIFFTVFLLSTIAISYAQFNAFGLRMGGHYSRQYLDINSNSALDDDVQDLSADFQVGLFSNLKLSEYTDLVPAFSYIRKPYKESYFTFKDTTIDFNVTETLIPRWDYLSVDVPFRLHKRNDNTLMYMFLGLRFEYLINTKQIIKQDSNLYDAFYDDFKRFSMGFIAGLGAEYTLNESWNILIEFTYNRDLTNVYSQDNLRIKAELMSLTIGLKFKTVKQGRVPVRSLEPEPDDYDQYDESD